MAQKPQLIMGYWTRRILLGAMGEKGASTSRRRGLSYPQGSDETPVSGRQEEMIVVFLERLQCSSFFECFVFLLVNVGIHAKRNYAASCG